MINSANAIAEPGVIRNSPGTKNRFTLGEPDGTISRRLQTISQAFERAGITTPLTATIRVDIWDKLVRNLSTSPICALTGEPIGVLGRHPELFALAKGLMREGLAVCAAHGIHIDLDPERAYGARPSSTHKSSMLQDFERRSPTRDRRPVDRGAGVRPRRGDRDAAARRDHRAGHREGAADGPLPARP